MATKARYVDVLSPVITVQDGDAPVLFEDILRFMVGKEYVVNEKMFTFALFQSPADENYIEGYVITTQDSDIPPKRNKQTGDFTAVNIDVAVEGFAYANVFLYDKTRKVLVYEINRNGCFPRQLIEAIYTHWNRVLEGEEERTRFSLNFSTFARRDEYNRMLQMSYYKKVSVELVNPQGIVSELLQENDSVENWIKETANKVASFNANTIKIEQTVFSRKVNPEGLSHNGVKQIVDKVLTLFGRGNIQKLEVQGYTDDAEEPKRCKPVDLLTDSFNEAFRIQDIQVHSDLQLTERKTGIEGLYNRILPEIRQILGH